MKFIRFLEKHDHDSEDTSPDAYFEHAVRANTVRNLHKHGDGSTRIFFKSGELLDTPTLFDTLVKQLNAKEW